MRLGFDGVGGFESVDNLNRIGELQLNPVNLSEALVEDDAFADYEEGARIGGYALLFREINSSASYELPLPFIGRLDDSVHLFEEDGSATLKGKVLSISVPQTLRLLWIKFGS